jgi:hypothetical protein
MQVAAEDVATLRRLEEQLMRPEVRRSPAEVGALLAEGFREFGSSGRSYDREQILEALLKESPRPEAHAPAIEDFAARQLAPTVILVTYRSVRTAPVASSTLRSSIWASIDGRWQMLFHQGTPTHG